LPDEDIKMATRYAHLSQEHKKKAVNLLNGLMRGGAGKKVNCDSGTYLNSLFIFVLERIKNKVLWDYFHVLLF
jgi:hypothetical protein